jgi:hypothetical protein
MTFSIANNDNTKDNRAKEEREGGGAIETEHNT